MPKQIIILERLDEPSDKSYRYVLWAAVPAGREPAYANASATSAYKDAAPDELAAIQAGQVVELAMQKTWTIDVDFTAIQADLQQQWLDFQSHITAANPFYRYGTFFDGNAWTSAGTP